MGKTYRTLVLKYDVSKLPPEEAGKIPALLKVQEEFRNWATEWAKSGGSLHPPERRLKYFAERFIHAAKALDWLKEIKKSGIEVKKLRPPLFFDIQLRLNDEKDIGRGVLVDLSKREVKIRRLGIIVLRLNNKVIEWILNRIKEGGKLVMAAVWVGRNRRSHAVKLYIALVFRREIAPMEAKRLLVIDVNALHNGLAWAVVEGERLVERGILRPNISKILHLQKVMAKLESICAKEDRSCDEAMAVKSRIWRLLRSWEDEAVKKIVRLALQYKAAIVIDVPDDNSVKELKEGGYKAEKKVFLNFGRIRRRLQGLAEWYGIPFREERLYSTICPICGAKMEELPNRRVRCQCGFSAHRDEVPIYWAQRRFRELITPSFSSSSAVLLRWAVEKGVRKKGGWSFAEPHREERLHDAAPRVLLHELFRFFLRPPLPPAFCYASHLHGHPVLQQKRPGYGDVELAEPRGGPRQEERRIGRGVDGAAALSLLLVNLPAELEQLQLFIYPHYVWEISQGIYALDHDIGLLAHVHPRPVWGVELALLQPVAVVVDRVANGRQLRLGLFVGLLQEPPHDVIETEELPSFLLGEREDFDDPLCRVLDVDFPCGEDPVHRPAEHAALDAGINLVDIRIVFPHAHIRGNRFIDPTPR